MNVEAIRDRVSQIEAVKKDFEAAHDMEDALYNDVLEHIANGGSDGQVLVKEALKAKQIEFVRYTA